MTGTACHLCTRPTGDDANVCTGCADTARDALRQVHGDRHTHGLAEDLDLTTARLTGAGPRAGGRSAETPLPLDLGSSEAAAVLRNTLATWCRTVHDDVGGDLPADTLTAMARWLATYTSWMRHTPYGHEALDEIPAAVDQARRAVDRPVRRIPLPVACRGVLLDDHGTPRPCDGELHATLPEGRIRCSVTADHDTTVETWTRRRGPRLPLVELR